MTPLKRNDNWMLDEMTLQIEEQDQGGESLWLNDHSLLKSKGATEVILKEQFFPHLWGKPFSINL